MDGEDAGAAAHSQRLGQWGAGSREVSLTVEGPPEQLAFLLFFWTPCRWSPQGIEQSTAQSDQEPLTWSSREDVSDLSVLTCKWGANQMLSKIPSGTGVL